MDSLNELTDQTRYEPKNVIAFLGIANCKMMYMFLEITLLRWYASYVDDGTIKED